MSDNSVSNLSDDISRIDLILSEDPLNKEFIFKIIEQFVDEPNQKVVSKIDGIFGDNIGASLMRIIIEDSDVIFKDVQSPYKTFYRSINALYKERALKGFSTRIMSPLALFTIDQVNLDRNLYRIFRVDNSYYDIELDRFAAFHLMNVSISVLVNQYNSESLDDDDKEYIKLKLKDFSEIISQIPLGMGDSNE
ncbi:hypothetical protein BK121_08960 [Paenibacillus odorifer]|uniref:hypothetical protein n=1 Tax=Paenibacillus odorifer TaxID=189426 RepID=UPI00096E16CA|nr:hypothetical protein [Paenibacillus odorifer]OMC73028.1 hypothetical protein BK121_08960 [Paenibacillus odorifer]